MNKTQEKFKYHYLTKSMASNVTNNQLEYFKKEATNAKF